MQGTERLAQAYFPWAIEATGMTRSDPFRQQIDENLQRAFDLPTGELPAALRDTLGCLCKDHHAAMSSSAACATDEPGRPSHGLRFAG